MTTQSEHKCIKGGTGLSREQVERAAKRVIADERQVSVWLSDDTLPTTMAWVDRHRLHAEEPYIGCPFCHDRFERKD